MVRQVCQMRADQRKVASLDFSDLGSQWLKSVESALGRPIRMLRKASSHRHRRLYQGVMRAATAYGRSRFSKGFIGCYFR